MTRIILSLKMSFERYQHIVEKIFCQAPTDDE